MKNADARLARLEQATVAAGPGSDYRETAAYQALSADDRNSLHAFERRYVDDGHLRNFSDEELDEFERLIMPIASEEGEDAQ